MPKWVNVDLGGDVAELQNRAGKYYHRKAIITWSEPVLWARKSSSPEIPDGWTGHGGVYAFLRDHNGQPDPNRISYIGKAVSFEARLNKRHPMYEVLVDKNGDTNVSLGRIRFERIHSRTAYYPEIEEIIAWAVWPYLHNCQGFESLPGFRGANGRPFKPWIIENNGYRFGRQMPRLIAYPSIAIARRL